MDRNNNYSFPEEDEDYLKNIVRALVGEHGDFEELLPRLFLGSTTIDNSATTEVLKRLKSLERSGLRAFTRLTMHSLKAEILKLQSDSDYQQPWELILCHDFIVEIEEEYSPDAGIWRLKMLLTVSNRRLHKGSKSVRDIVIFAENLCKGKPAAAICDEVKVFCGFGNKEYDKPISVICNELIEKNNGIMPKSKSELKQEIRGIFSSAAHYASKPRLYIKVFDYRIYLIKASIAAKETFGYHPRPAQLAAVISMICNIENKSSEIFGNLYEILTGEGKSLVQAIIAGYLVIVERVKVDIITSSSELAKREGNDMKKFYNHLGIKCTALTKEDSSKDRRKAYEHNDVCYSSPDEFIFDVLRDETEEDDGDRVRTRRPFQFLIIDEVDKVLIDDFNHSYRISKGFTATNHVEFLLTMIWGQIHRYQPVTIMGKKFMTAGYTSIWNTILEAVEPYLEECAIKSYDDLIKFAHYHKLIHIPHLDDCHGRDGEETILKLDEFDKKLNEQMTTDKVLDLIELLNGSGYLGQTRFIPILSDGDEISASSESADCREFKIVIDDGICCLITELDEFKDMVFGYLKKNIRFGSKDHYSDDNKEAIYLPKMIEAACKPKLEAYVDSAVRAKMLEENKQYIIKDKKVRIVNISTGEVRGENCHWSDGLHTFVNLKHGLPLGSAGSKNNNMSIYNFVFKYAGNVIGVSGTLAIETDGRVLREIFKMNTWKIPSFRHVLRREMLPIITRSNFDTWIEAVVREAFYHSSKLQRVVLIVAENIKTCDIIIERMRKQKERKVNIQPYYRNDKQNHTKTVLQVLKAGTIFVASNLGGRGTDYRLDETVVQNGGLHVIQTFFADNDRIEQQQAGRSGRKGEPGSVQMILEADKLPSYFGNSLKEARKNRAHKVDNSFKNLAKDVEMIVKYRQVFMYWINRLQDQDHLSKAQKDELKQQFSIWYGNLDDSKVKRTSLKHLTGEVDILLTNLLKWGEDRHLHSISSNFLLNFSKENDLSAINMAIQYDPDWAAIPLYLKAGQEAKNGQLHSAFSTFQKAVKCITKLTDEVTTQYTLLAAIGNFKESNDKESSYQKTALEARISVLNQFQANIEANMKELKMIMDKKLKYVVKTKQNIKDLYQEQPTDFEKTEVHRLQKLGLNGLIKVKEKKPFCWSALLCTLLGVAQVIGGIAAIVLSCGAATSLGVNLISEGVSDCIAGVKGMISGTFSWIQWAISKAISLAITLVCFGIGKLAKYGSKCLKAGKEACKEGWSVIKASRAVLGCAETANIAKTACKVVLKEATVQTVSAGLQLLSDGIFKEVTNKIFEEVKKDLYEKCFKSLSTGTLSKSGFTDAALLKVCNECYDINDHVFRDVDAIKNYLYSYMFTATKQICSSSENSLVEVLATCEKIIQLTKEIRSKAGNKKVQLAMSIGGAASTIAAISFTIRESVNLNDKIERKLIGKLEHMIDDDNIELPMFNDMPRERRKCLQMLAKGFSDAYAEILQNIIERGVVSYAKTGVMSVVNNRVNSKLSQKLGTTKDIANLNQYGVKHLVSNCYNRKHVPTRKEIASNRLKSQQNDSFKKWQNSILDENVPAGCLEMRAYCDKNKKSVKIYRQSANGDVVYDCKVGSCSSNGEKNTIKMLYFPGKDGGAGHYQALTNDNTIVDLSTKNNCMYECLAIGESRRYNKRSATEIRNEINNEVQSNHFKYRPMFENKLKADSYAKDGKSDVFMDGGLKKPKQLFDEKNEGLKKYNRRLNKIKREDHEAFKDFDEFMKSYCGTYKDCKNELARLRRKHPILKDMPVDIDHPIPKAALRKLEKNGETNSKTYQYFIRECGNSYGTAVNPNLLPGVPARRAAHRNQMTSGNQEKFHEHFARQIRNDDLNRLSHYVDCGTDPDGKFKMKNVDGAFGKDDSDHRQTRSKCSALIKECSIRANIPYKEKEYDIHAAHEFSESSQADIYNESSQEHDQ